MQTPETHTSREIAQAMVDRAFARVFPQPVELPAIECPECEGQGGGEAIVGGWEVPRFEHRTCPKCDGEGASVQICDAGCTDPATTVIFDPKVKDKVECILCEECALSTLHLDGLDLAIAWGLVHAVAMEIEVGQ